MEINIITPDKTVFSGKARLVQFPGADGSFAVLRNHAPMVAVLGEGKIRIDQENNKRDFIPISGGLVELKKNVITVLAD
jgi:F-type H+-transporting ATPase subunit epsilon